MNTLLRKLSLITVILMTGACASTASQSSYQAASNCNAMLSKEQMVHLDLVQNLIEKDQYYSALAHLEGEAHGSPRALWLRAEAQRKTGLLSEAYSSYRDLSLSCMTAAGHSGMAKILATRGDLAVAHQHMLKARRLAPTSADIRNDYGFILLAMRDFKAAQREFMTALQLQPGHSVAIRNMVISLILDGDSRTALRMASNNNIDEQEFNTLLVKANHFAEPALAQQPAIKKDAKL